MALDVVGVAVEEAESGADEVGVVAVGEAEGADVAVFAGNKRGIIYVQGERVANVKEEERLTASLDEGSELILWHEGLQMRMEYGILLDEFLTTEEEELGGAE